MIKEKRLKEIFKRKGFKISSENIKKFSKTIEDEIEKRIDLVIRNARISGRKTIKRDDF